MYIKNVSCFVCDSVINIPTYIVACCILFVWWKTIVDDKRQQPQFKSTYIGFAEHRMKKSYISHLLLLYIHSVGYTNCMQVYVYSIHNVWHNFSFKFFSLCANTTYIICMHLHTSYYNVSSIILLANLHCNEIPQ